MTEDRPQSKLFEAFSRELLGGGSGLRFEARGASMFPAICDGDVVSLKPAVLTELQKGDIVLVKGARGFRLHRLVAADLDRDVFITRGDCAQEDDPAVSRKEVVGVAVAKEVRVGSRMVRAKLKGMRGRFLCSVARGQSLLTKLLSRAAALGSDPRHRTQNFHLGDRRCR